MASSRRTGAVVLALALTGCSGAGRSGAPATPPAPSASATQPGPSAEEARDALPPPLTLSDVGGRTIRASPFPDFAVASGSSVWVTGVVPGLVGFDASTGRVLARVRIDAPVTQALEVAGGDVVVPTGIPTSGSRTELLRVDAGTGRVTGRTALPQAPVGEGVVGAVGDTSYVLVGEDSPQLLEVRGDRVRRTVPVSSAARGVRAGFGALWVPTSEDTVQRLDLTSGARDSIPVGPGPRFLDVGFGAVWVMDQGDGSVTRIDAGTRDVERIPVTGVPIGGGDLTCGGGAVWLRTDDAVLRIDPDTRDVTHRLTLPAGSGSVAATATSLWVTNHDHLAVHRIPLPLPD